MPPNERKNAIALGVQLPGVSDEEHASNEIHVVLNWHQELLRLVPVN